MQNVNATTQSVAKKVGANVKPSISFSKKSAGNIVYEVKAETGTTKIKGAFPVTVTIIKREKYEVVNADEIKFYGDDAESKGTEKFLSIQAAILAGTYKFPDEIEAAPELEAA
jgi:hypothetical protein